MRKKCGLSSGSSLQQSTIKSTNSGLTSTEVRSGRNGGSSCLMIRWIISVLQKEQKKNCSIQMENSLCPVWHDVSSQPRKSSEFPSWESHSKTLTMFSVCFCFQVFCCFFVHKCSLLTRGWESFSDKGSDFYHQRIFLKIPKVSDDSKRPATNLFSQK